MDDNANKSALERHIAELSGLLASRECDTFSTAESDAVLAGLSALRAQLAQASGIDLDALVYRFLGWPLPDSVCADPCASMQGAPHRTGTNLLSAIEAKAMLQHVLGGIAAPAVSVSSVSLPAPYAIGEFGTPLVTMDQLINYAEAIRRLATTPAAPAQPEGGDAVADVADVMGFPVIQWRTGRDQPVGTTLYTRPAPAQQAWQPIETAPKDGKEVLLYWPDGPNVVAGWWDRNTWRPVVLESHGCGCCGGGNTPPTHWMPLPEPPLQEQRGQ